MDLTYLDTNKDKIITKWKCVMDSVNVLEHLIEPLSIYAEYYTALDIRYHSTAGSGMGYLYPTNIIDLIKNDIKQISYFDESSILPLSLRILSKLNFDNKKLIVDYKNEYKIENYKIRINFEPDIFHLNIDIVPHLESLLINEVITIINEKFENFNTLIIRSTLFNKLKIIDKRYIECIYSLKYEL